MLGEASAVHYDRIIRSLLAASRSDHWPQIEALGVGGSYARRDATDEYSDLDLFLILKDDGLEPFIQRMSLFAAEGGNILLFRGPVYVEGYGHSFTVLYEPLLTVQYNLNSRSGITRGPTRKHTKVLYDKMGFYGSFTDSQRKAEADLTAVFVASTSFFWLRALNVWRDLARGHIWLAIHHLTDVRRQLFVLARVQLQQPPLDFYTVEKGIEQDLGVDLCAGFAEGIPTYSAASVRQCLLYCIQWYSSHAPQVATALGVRYPSEAAERISQVISCSDTGI